MLLIAAEKSRPVMWDMPTGVQVLWYLLAGISILVFLYGVWRPISRYRRNPRSDLPPLSELPGRFWRATVELYEHAQIKRRDPYVGWAHRGIFYGWVALAIGTVIVALDHDVTGPILGFHFFQGDFYLGYKAVLNALGLALIAGVLMMMIRRAIIKPAKLDYTRPDREPGDRQYDRRTYRIGDWAFVVSLFVIAVTGYVLQGARLAMDDPGYTAFMFGSILPAELMGGLSNATLADIRHGIWWFHGILAIAFVASIPYTKAAHMLSSFASSIIRDPDAKRRLRPIPEQQAEPGYATLAAFSRRHLINLDACTKCGKCHEVCPATATGRPLSPRDVILELREQSHAEQDAALPGPLGALLRPEEPRAQIFGADGIRPETAWACFQCNACVEVCPVGIEQGPIINEMRRSLVERGELDDDLQSTFATLQKSGNSFGQSRRRRGRWTEELEFEVADARTQEVDVLWFVGDYASFDPRSQRVTRTIATLLHEAGVDFGILYDGERNSGNDVRRAGEEGLFEMLAEHNISTLEECEFERIMTSDPHSLNTLRNEYPELGGSWTVIHHTELLRSLLEEGRLSVRTPLERRVTYHDPCYLGRMNGGFDSPRRILELVGCDVVEMPRNREASYCCGAGGGRIWIADEPGVRRPSEERIEEAIALTGIDYFVVSCPKDVTMYEDAIKTSGHEGEIELRELSELILEAIELGEPALAGAGGGKRG